VRRITNDKQLEELAVETVVGLVNDFIAEQTPETLAYAMLSRGVQMDREKAAKLRALLDDAIIYVAWSDDPGGELEPCECCDEDDETQGFRLGVA
jgi:hypothetical protein